MTPTPPLTSTATAVPARRTLTAEQQADIYDAITSARPPSGVRVEQMYTNLPSLRQNDTAGASTLAVKPKATLLPSRIPRPIKHTVLPKLTQKLKPLATEHPQKGKKPQPQVLWSKLPKDFSPRIRPRIVTDAQKQTQDSSMPKITTDIRSQSGKQRLLNWADRVVQKSVRAASQPTEAQLRQQALKVRRDEWRDNKPLPNYKARNWLRALQQIRFTLESGFIVKQSTEMQPLALHKVAAVPLHNTRFLITQREAPNPACQGFTSSLFLCARKPASRHFLPEVSGANGRISDDHHYRY